MSWIWFLLALLLHYTSLCLVSAFNNRLVTRPALRRWSLSPPECGINWRPLRRRHFPCFSRMPLKDQEKRRQFDQIMDSLPKETPPTVSTTLATSLTAARSFQASPRIVGGNSSLRGEFPWHAVIDSNIITGTNTRGSFIYEWQRGCGATFILQNWLVTAAHCLYSWGEDNPSNPDEKTKPLPTNRLRLKYGSDPPNYDALTQVNIAAIFIHPEFVFNSTLGGFEKAQFDLGLIRLQQPVFFTLRSRPDGPESQRLFYFANAICLPEEPWQVGDQNQQQDAFHFSSFGPNTYVMPPTKTNTPQKFMLRPYDLFIPVNNTMEQHLIADLRVGHAICRGDSGSPLVYHNSDGRFFLVGALSTANPLANNKTICVNIWAEFVPVNIDENLRWIKDTIISASNVN